MKPAAFAIVRPQSLDEACRILHDTEGARVIAGAQSLGPMLNLRLARPPLLVDITGIAALTRIAEEAGGLTIGACVTHANIEDGRLPGNSGALLAGVASRIAYRAVRNRGTIGGSLAHADPAADWVSALSALSVQCRIATPQGERSVAIEQFVRGAFDTALGQGEVLAAIHVPAVSARAGWGYAKLCRKAGEFSLATGAVLNDPGSGRLCAVLGATRGRPIVVADAVTLLRQRNLPALDERAVASLLGSNGITEAVPRRQHLTMLQRAFEQAMAR